MLRTLLLLIVLLLAIGLVLVMTGVVNLRQDADGTVALETRDVEVGTTTTNVKLPVVRMEDRTVETPEVGVVDRSEANAQ